MTYSPETYQRNKEAILRAQKKYYLKNREKRLANQKKYDDEHREQIRERRKNALELSNPATETKEQK